MFRETTAQDRPLATKPAWRRWLPLIVIAAIVVIGAILLLPGLRSLLSVNGSINASRLSIAPVIRGDLVRDVAADARVVAAIAPTLYAPAAGSVTLKVQAGDKVAKEQVIAEIDSPELRNKLLQERAVLGGLEVDVQRTELDSRKQQMSVQEAYDRAEVEQKTAARELQRSRKAYDLGAYSELQVLRAEDALAKADFGLDHAKKDLGLQPEQTRFDAQSKTLARDRQRLLVNDLHRQVQSLALRSPVSGQIGQLLTAERASVAKDAPLLTVIDLSALELELKVPESFARELAIGMPAQITGGGTWAGKVSSVSPEVVSGQVSARVKFADGTPDGLRQNQRLSVRILLDERKDVLTLTRGSFVDQDGGRFAYVVHDGLAERKPIKLGAIGIDKVEVLEGLQTGDQVVVSGSDAFDGAERVGIAR
jgi:HlyD family secretion protein